MKKENEILKLIVENRLLKDMKEDCLKIKINYEMDFCSNDEIETIEEKIFENNIQIEMLRNNL